MQLTQAYEILDFTFKDTVKHCHDVQLSKGSVWILPDDKTMFVRICYEDEGGRIPMPLCDKVIQIEDVAGDKPELYCYIKVAPGVL